MSMQITAVLSGDKRLLRQLRRLGTTGARKVLRSSINKSTTLIVRSIKAEFPPSAKSLKKVVGKRVRVNKKDGIVAKVGMNVGKKRAAQMPHGHLYVMGTAKRYAYTQQMARRGVMPAHNVVDRGYARVESQARNVLVKGISAGIQKEAGRT